MEDTVRFHGSLGKVGEPCRNFCIFAQMILQDPRDGREKLVLSNFSSMSVGSLILIDTQNGAGEAIPLPGDSGAWALCQPDEDTLLVGTCEEHGYLHRLDLRTRTWAKTLSISGETYIWNLVLGSDGKVYGGTYPGCLLICYDPKLHQLETKGRMSPHPGNLYTRHVYAGIPGYLIVSGGMEQPFLQAWSLREERFRPFGRQGAAVLHVTEHWICTELEEIREYIDPATWEVMAEPDGAESLLSSAYSLNERIKIPVVQGAKGYLYGVRGQEYITVAPDGSAVLRRIPTAPPPTGIHTLILDGEGKIWGSCALGQTIFWYDPDTEERWNSPSVCDGGGEVYGMVFIDQRLYMASYSGGDHIEYRPDQAWNQVDNINPRTLHAIGPQWIRPLGRSALGPGGELWTGWSARYGVYGGAISRLNSQTGEVEIWENPVQGQQVSGIAADGNYIYFTTNGGGNGMVEKAEPHHFVVADKDQVIHFQKPMPEGVGLSAITVLEGLVLIAAGTRILGFDPARMRFIHEVGIPEPCSLLLPLDSGKAAAFCGTALWLINAEGNQAEHVYTLPGPVRAAVLRGKDQLYFGVGTELYVVRIAL